MTATISDSIWRPLACRLAERLEAEGDLHSPEWRAALLAVPRHVFVPRYYVQDISARPLRWILHEPSDAESTAAWLELVYSPTTLVTELAEFAGRGVLAPVSSSTKPDLMIRMLEALQVGDGMQVLEIGTGTGYNAALLTHRLDGRNVFSVDIDPRLVDAARERLARLGYRPTLAVGDGLDGLPEHAPFERIIATCAMFAVPPAWIRQLLPGGLALVHIEGPLGAGNLVALRKISPHTLQGPFLPWWGCFMRRRPTAEAAVGTPRPVRTDARPTSRTTRVDPARLDGGQQFPFLAQLQLPHGVVRTISRLDNGTTVTELRAPDGSWCQVTRVSDVNGHFPVHDAGPTSLWARVETAWREWAGLGEPAWHEFGLTITPDQHTLWHRSPDSERRWSWPAPPT